VRLFGNEFKARGRRRKPLEELIHKDETNLSAQQSAAKTDPRVPRPDGVARRTSCAQTAAQQGPPPSDGFDPAQTARVGFRPNAHFGKEHRLRRRADFLRVRRLGIRFQTVHFAVYLAKLPDQEAARFGASVSRRIGKAVVRNRTKRRLRETFRCSLRPVLAPGSVMLVIARQGADQVKTREMTAELMPALIRMAQKLESISPKEE
jgi:ribonuclease P protein component